MIYFVPQQHSVASQGHMFLALRVENLCNI